MKGLHAWDHHEQKRKRGVFCQQALERMGAPRVSPPPRGINMAAEAVWTWKFSLDGQLQGVSFVFPSVGVELAGSLRSQEPGYKVLSHWDPPNQTSLPRPRLGFSEEWFGSQSACCTWIVPDGSPSLPRVAQLITLILRGTSFRTERSQVLSSLTVHLKAAFIFFLVLNTCEDSLFFPWRN